MEVDANSNVVERYEAYSCSRCRRLKKRCTKEWPSCKNCSKAGEECVYPGRAPRRTIEELRQARLRGEAVGSKRRKVEKKSFDSSGSDSISNTYASPGFSDNGYLQSEGVDQPQQSESASLRKGVDVVSASPAKEDSAEHIDGVSSLVWVLSAMGDGGNGSPSPLSSMTNGATLSPLHTIPSIANFNFSTNSNSNSNSNTKGYFTQLSMSSYANREPKKENKAQLQYNQAPVYSEPSEVDSIPVRASNIQIEAVKGIYKGGRTTPWLSEDHKFKHIERSLYDRFIAAYFKHNHKSFYMMDKVAFLNRVSTIRDFSTLGEEYEDTFVFQLYMAMAIGSTTLQRAGLLKPEEEDLTEHFSYIAMQNFRSVVHHQNIETIKCLILLGIFALFEPKGVSSWTISGIIMRLCIGLGFSRALSNEKLKRLSPVDAELRYRVFWSAYCFERLVSTSLGRLSAIDDDEITTPLPTPLNDEEKEDIEVSNMMISLRRTSGRIYKKVHSCSVGRKNHTVEEKNAIIDSLRKEIDEIYNKERAKLQQKNANNWRGGNTISFHSSDIWLAMRYAQLLIMLYRPSALIPKPPMDSLTLLGEFCLKALKHTYTLYKKKLLPLNWITLFRTLTICNTILYCLCHWSIDLVESKIEIQQCVEILKHFGEKWVFAMKCADVFQSISNTILEVSLSSGQLPNMDELTKELFGASDEYQEILYENNVDVSWIDKMI